MRRAPRPLGLALALLAALPAVAQDARKDALGAAGFEALVEGRTLTYAFEDGQVWGVERFYPGRRVTWFPTDGTPCLEGKWYAEGPSEAPRICFAYTDDPDSPHCFPFFRDGQDLRYLDGATALSGTDLGPEHGLAFGCEYLGA